MEFYEDKRKVLFSEVFDETNFGWSCARLVMSDDRRNSFPWEEFSQVDQLKKIRSHRRHDRQRVFAVLCNSSRLQILNSILKF